ncbi:MAG: L,D-transpeptidase family protein [Rhizobiales bacterium]|nr:L,D-transpeptidase family protein [Hyphomicrobiales bacterium]
MRLHRVLAALVLAAGLVGFGRTAGAAVFISIDKTAQQMMVNVDGELRWIWPVSTGRDGYDTPSGGYTAFRMAKAHYSREWDDAPMPHSIFFTQVGHAIHGTNQIRRLGQPASHGCVRLAPENAAQLFALVRKHGLPNTKVTIKGDTPATPAVAEPRRPAGEHSNSVRADQTPDQDVVNAGTAVPLPTRAARSYAPPRNADRPDPPPPRAKTSAHNSKQPPRLRARAYSPPPRKDWRQQRAARAYAAPRDDELPRRPAPRAYATPHAYAVPRIYEKPRGIERQRVPASPPVYYEPHVEVIEDTKINGTWVRRRYYRAARPQDFSRWR